MLPLVDLFHKGLPPVAGGTLDQTAWFIAASRAVAISDAAVRDAAT